MRPGITQEEYLSSVSDLRLQFLKTRGGSEIHPEGISHYLNPRTMRISERFEMPKLFPQEPPSTFIVEQDLEELEEEYGRDGRW